MRHFGKSGGSILHRRRSGILSAGLIALTTVPIMLGGCNSSQVLTNGPQITSEQLGLVPVGSSRDQVLLALGSPSATGTFDNEVFYYITQTRQRTFAFQKLKLTDQRVLAIYFDEEDTVTQVADYGMQDGKVFDFISRTTPTGGKDQTFIQRLLAPSTTPIKPGAAQPAPGEPGF